MTLDVIRFEASLKTTQINSRYVLERPNLGAELFAKFDKRLLAGRFKFSVGTVNDATTIAVSGSGKNSDKNCDPWCQTKKGNR